MIHQFFLPIDLLELGLGASLRQLLTKAISILTLFFHHFAWRRINQDIIVRLKWGKTEYTGRLRSVDSYMNVQLSETEEFIDGKSTGMLGEVFIRYVLMMRLSPVVSLCLFEGAGPYGGNEDNADCLCFFLLFFFFFASSCNNVLWLTAKTPTNQAEKMED